MEREKKNKQANKASTTPRGSSRTSVRPYLCDPGYNAFLKPKHNQNIIEGLPLFHAPAS